MDHFFPNVDVLRIRRVLAMGACMHRGATMHPRHLQKLQYTKNLQQIVSSLREREWKGKESLCFQEKKEGKELNY
jgi:hypothetical protein